MLSKLTFMVIYSATRYLATKSVNPLPLILNLQLHSQFLLCFVRCFNSAFSPLRQDAFTAFLPLPENTG